MKHSDNFITCSDEDKKNIKDETVLKRIKKLEVKIKKKKFKNKQKKKKVKKKDKKENNWQKKNHKKE